MIVKSTLGPDRCRHKEDDRANKRIVSVVKKRGNCEVKSEAIKVGDIIHLKEDQEVPCDAIVLSTSHAQVGIICCPQASAALEGF